MVKFQILTSNPNFFFSRYTYVWSESHNIASYFNWAEGQPSRADGEDCSWKAIPRQNEEGSPGWHDAGCLETVYHGEIHALCQGLNLS